VREVSPVIAAGGDDEIEAVGMSVEDRGM